MLRYLTAGESHGKALTALIEGLPAGVKIEIDQIKKKMRLRQGGYGRGGRMDIETDTVQFTAGLRGGMTLGSPLALQIENKDWPNWQEHMDALAPAFSAEKNVTRPRPGHADLAGALKYRHTDLRNILERASARETAARVAVGAIAQEFLRPFGIRVQGQVVAVGGIHAEICSAIADESIYDDPFYCMDTAASAQMRKRVDEAREKGDTLGGIFQVIAEGLPPGLGSHVQADRKLDGLIAQGLMSIPSVKGVEIGEGFLLSGFPGSEVHDEIAYSPEKGYDHATNRAGGLEGGITNGEVLLVRAAVKPIPTLLSPLRSVDMLTKEAVPAAFERSDVCVVPAASIVGEAALAWVLAQAVLDKFGGDHLEETLDNYRRYREYLRTR
ncbi:MAG: chorismate synthase [Clostridia bacterium]|jgi:chorismate synthase|nr:chorismate synthase [Clostridia bacterium]